MRTLRRKIIVLIVKMIHEEAGGENVTVGKIRLKLGEIADTKGVIIVLIDGQFGVDGVVVFAVEGVVEPDFSFFDGS